MAPALDLPLNCEEALCHLNSVLDWEAEEEVTEVVAMGMNQKQLSMLVDGTVHRTLLEATNCTHDKARLMSVGLPHAGDWSRAAVKVI